MPGAAFIGNPAWLAGSADRERAVGVLRAAFTEGRLTQDELDDRVARAYAARTYGDLWALTADLPAGPLPYPHARPGLTRRQSRRAARRRARSSWHSAAALVITALVIFTLAALVTAIVTAHAQPMPFQQGPFQQAQLEPVPARAAGPVHHDAGSHREQGSRPRPFGPYVLLAGLRSPGWVDSAATKASCGTSTRPMVFIRFLPSFCLSSSLRLRVMSPP